MKYPLLIGILALTSCGLETHIKTDVRKALTLCTGEEFVARVTMCQALLKEAAQVNGPVTVIVSDAPRLMQELASRGLTPEQFLNSPLSTKYARANIFSLPKLSTGSFSTLDGVVHSVVCQQNDNLCRIDGAISGSADSMEAGYVGGKLFTMNGWLPF